MVGWLTPGSAKFTPVATRKVEIKCALDHEHTTSTTLTTMTTHHPRRHPIILITGTPGTGKTLHSQVLATECDSPLVHLNIGDIVKEHGFHEGYDEEWKSYIVDEDRLLDYLEEVVNPVDGPAETGESLCDSEC